MFSIIIPNSPEMKKTLPILLLIFLGSMAKAQNASLDSLYQLAVEDLSGFSKYLIADAKTEQEKAEKIIDWLARNFDWTATDYKKRTLKQILERKGGNCAELARVAAAAFEEVDLKMRRVREINLHIKTDRRQVTAEAKVKELGNRASVFGRQHNDHVWLEIFDPATKVWIPADPSLGVVGQKAWLSARYGFGKRYSLDPTSADMIAPFAVFAMEDGAYVDRSVHYAIEGFNGLYQHQLSQYPAWEQWKMGIEKLSKYALSAFLDKDNLHEQTTEIAELSAIYAELKEQFLASDFGQIHQNIEAFSSALIKQDIATVVEAYTKDAKIFPTRGPILEGHSPIRKYWSPNPKSESQTIYHKIWPSEITVEGNTAYDHGYYEGKTQLADGRQSHWRGKYVIVWHKTETGDWKMYIDIWNRM
mgnify:CR=1 FL=1